MKKALIASMIAAATLAGCAMDSRTQLLATEGSAVPLDAFAEDIATLDEEAMNDYLEHGALSVGRLRSMIAVRSVASFVE